MQFTPFEDLLNSVLTAFKTLHSTGSYKVQDLFKTEEYKQVIKQTATILKQPVLDNVIKKGMQQALEQDVFIFSALKTHVQLFEASRMLLDEEGKVKPFSKFQQDFKKLTTDYNETYLETEYNFAVNSSIMAGKWSELDDDAILQYRTMRDDKVRDEHRVLDRTTLPKSDPFWLEYYPPNGWNCRCTTIEVRKGKYEESDSVAAIEAGKTATTKYGKDGFNSLELFRFNPGMQQVVFPPNHPYSKVQDANIIKQTIKETTAKESFEALDLNTLIKKDIPTNNEVKDIITKYAEQFGDDFRNGLESVKIAKSKSYLMQHSMSYSPATGEWKGGSTISISSHSFGNFNPLDEIKGAFAAIKKGEKLTFNQEYSLESLWHEILHAKTKTKPLKLSSFQVKSMETINQFVARHTYPDFMKRLGGTASNQADILDKGYGYSSWITEFRKRIVDSNLTEKEALEYFEPHLMKNYGDLSTKIREFFTEK
ncbi:phage (Mu-like) virion morphogenesis protein [Myroides odoratimimus]|uniref:phage head morphogenesis protein n=1 Tax=Myroides odoratimimus TaxID=76832 RepID=UPI000725A9A0|nr:phage minor head protein [Myroides odoratimimus]GAQ15445.1 phage (Mu-like) virion morphogenesis protein [Myroides odoratimimus]